MLKIKEGYKLKDGRVLSTEEMMAVDDFYKIACTQEYICEVFGLNEEDAWLVANEVQECMKRCDDGINEEKFAREFIEFHGFHSSLKHKIFAMNSCSDSKIEAGAKLNASGAKMHL